MGSKWKCNNSPCSIQSIPTNTFAPVYNSVIPELAAGRKPLSGMCTYQRGVLSFWLIRLPTGRQLQQARGAKERTLNMVLGRDGRYRPSGLSSHLRPAKVGGDQVSDHCLSVYAPNFFANLGNTSPCHFVPLARVIITYRQFSKLDKPR
jgi:hypothetical protein